MACRLKKRMESMMTSTDPNHDQSTFNNVKKTTEKRLEITDEAMLQQPVRLFVKPETVSLRTDETIAQGLARVRARPFRGEIVYFYVVDEDEKLKGVVSTRDLLLTPPDRIMGEIMNRRIVKIKGESLLLDAIEYFSLYPYLAFPVIDDQGRILGTLNLGLYKDSLNEIAEREEDLPDQELYELIGVNPSDTRRGTIANAVRLRLPWLFSNVAGGLFAALVAESYKELLERVVVLALFVPVVLSLAESVAMQSATLGIESGQSGSLTWGKLRRLLRRELFSGLCLGLCCGLAVAILATVWQGDMRLGGVLFVSMSLSMTFSAMLAILLPLCLHAFQLNPTLAAGPLALVFADLTALTIYFRIGVSVWPDK
jgi:magnesium transporter